MSKVAPLHFVRFLTFGGLDVSWKAVCRFPLRRYPLAPILREVRLCVEMRLSVRV